MAKRLTRKEIKRDEVLEGFGRGVQWLEEHGRALLYGLGALVAAALVGAGIWALLESRSARASDALAEAVRAAAAPLASEAPPGTELTFPDAAARTERAKELFGRVTAGYGSSQEASVGRLYLAKFAATEGNAEEARRLWGEVLERQRGSVLAAEAELNLIQLDRQEGKSEELEARLRAMLEDRRRALPEDTVLRELALTLEELGRAEEALQLFQRIVDEFPASPYLPEAQQRTRGAGGQADAVLPAGS